MSTRAPATALFFALLSLACACDGGEASTPADAGTMADGGGLPDAGVGAIEPDPFEPPPPPAPLPESAIDEAARAISGILATVPYSHGALVVNATTGQVVFESNADDALKPASNAKLYTTAAAIEILGEDHRMRIVALGTAPIDADGTLDGNLVVIGEHDFTLSTLIFGAARYPLDRVAELLAREGLRRVTGTLDVRGEYVYEGDSVGYLDVAAHRATVAARMRDALSAAGIAVAAVTNGPSLDPPAGATPLADYESPPLFVACSPLNNVSHNEFADLLVRHLGWHGAGESGAAAGTSVIVEWLRSLDVPTGGVVLHDGSGLSHDNRVTPRATVEMMDAMRELPAGPLWRAGLSISGVRGTLSSRLDQPDVRGRVFGKTGTLRDTITLSGHVVNGYDGQLYLFSLLLNDVTSATTGRDRLDDVVRVIGRDHRGAGARPSPPELRSARATGTAGIVEIAWQPVDGADGYVVWLGEDGRTFSRERARYVTATTFLAGDLDASDPTYVQVTAVGESGESDPSATYAAVAAAGSSDILFVDANDRWRAEPQGENTLSAHHAFIAELAIASSARRFDAVSNEAVAEGDVDLDAYRAVVWVAGEESTDHESFSADEQALVRAYVEAGGALVVSGAEVAWDLGAEGSAEDQAFLTDVLHVAYGEDDAESHLVEGTPGTAFEPVVLTSFFSPDAMNVDYPDVLVPTAGSTPILQYASGTRGVAALAADRVVVTGFPIESIASDRDRAALLDAILAHVGAE